jgi:hypothetical protein
VHQASLSHLNSIGGHMCKRATQSQMSDRTLQNPKATWQDRGRAFEDLPGQKKKKYVVKEHSTTNNPGGVGHPSLVLNDVKEKDTRGGTPSRWFKEQPSGMRI